MSLEIKCTQCGGEVVHDCHGEGLRQAVIDLYSYCPGFFPAGTRLPYAEKRDKDAPFFSEAYLYNLMGKQDARSILARVSNLLRAVGIDARALEVEAWHKLVAERKAYEAEMERRKRWTAAVMKVKKRLRRPVSEPLLSRDRDGDAEYEKRRALVDAELDKIIKRAEKRKKA